MRIFIGRYYKVIYRWGDFFGHDNKGNYRWGFFIGYYYKVIYRWGALLAATIRVDIYGFVSFRCNLLPYMKGGIFLDVSEILDHKEI